ncbi:MAG: DUF3526 domain-containing protein [Sphingobacteriales bacterium]|nr:MAG: DUF3526 domain-containing protein [Sphingobacteriales bacterium]
MNKNRIIARHFLQSIVRSGAMLPLYIIWLLLIAYAGYSSFDQYTTQNKNIEFYQHTARESWEANPDKHPHRMAHFGSFAFRVKHPLSMFDNGMESFTGNAVYLEAHKQNTSNFSEAGFSTGLLRFGEMSISMLLQILLPLIIFFLGFNAIAQQRENGTLKILLSQGAGFRNIILGNSIGLFAIAAMFLLPALLMAGLLAVLQNNAAANAGLAGRALVIFLSSIAFIWIMSLIAVCVSALSNTGRTALLKLLGIWLLMAVVLPKTLQAAGSYIHPAPGKIEMEAAVETDILKLGDSHNPDDAHYKRLKDSLLAVHKVDSIQQLPFNYSGFQMQEGERMSAQVYNAHLKRLHDIYDRQNAISYASAFINPLTGIKNISMAFSGTDFGAYRSFQEQAENYRYHLAQSMNALQMKYISNYKPGPNDKPQIIEKEHWSAFPDFEYKYQDVSIVLQQQLPALVAMLLWLVFSYVLIYYTSKKAKAI